MTEFGPNKTSSSFYLKLVLIVLIVLVVAFTVTVVLFSTVPELRKLKGELFNVTEARDDAKVSTRGMDEGEVSTTTQTSDIVEARTKSQEDEDDEPRPGSIVIDYVEKKPFTKFTGEDLVIDTKLGLLKGRRGNFSDLPIDVFLGVPFAEPPLGDLRFKRPVPVKPWTGIKKATRLTPHCVQHFEPDVVITRTPTIFEISEDCLYINIWAPAYNQSNSGSKLKPVMIWFFGGGYGGGTINLDETDGRALAALGDVVVVSVNYRNGALGFLNLDLPDSYGNQGLYDNAVAIEWVKSNIKEFGGDPDEITLFGQSAGAINIGLFMVSPRVRPLFRRAILESGSPIMLSFFFSRTAETAQNFKVSMGCVYPGNETENHDLSPDELEDKGKEWALNCLKGKTAAEIIAGQKPLLEKAFPFTPTPYDDDLLPSMPSDILNEDTVALHFNNTHEVMMGGNSDEGSVVLFLEIPEVFAFDKVHLNITKLSELRELLVNNFSKEFDIPEDKATIFANTFFNKGPEEDTTENLVKRLYQVIGDMAFMCPVTALADDLARANKTVYLYEFGQRAKASPWGPWMGVPHGDEYVFVFGHPLRYPERYSEADVEMSARMIQTWAHFARTGEALQQLGVAWPKYTFEREEYMQLKANEAKVGSKLHADICTYFKLSFNSLRRRRRRRSRKRRVC